MVFYENTSYLILRVCPDLSRMPFYATIIVLVIQFYSFRDLCLYWLLTHKHDFASRLILLKQNTIPTKSDMEVNFPFTEKTSYMLVCTIYILVGMAITTTIIELVR